MSALRTAGQSEQAWVAQLQDGVTAGLLEGREESRLSGLQGWQRSLQYLFSIQADFETVFVHEDFEVIPALAGRVNGGISRQHRGVGRQGNDTAESGII